MTTVARPTTDAAARPLRIAVLSAADPGDRTAASGSGYGLVQGFRDLGHTVTPIHVALGPFARRRARVSALVDQTRIGRRPLAERWRCAATTSGIDPQSFRTRSRIAQRALRAVGPVDLIVQATSDFLVDPGSTPLVTREDVTVAQARRHPINQQVVLLSDRRYDLWRRQQAELYRRATACGVTSHWTGSSIVEEYGVDSARVVVVGLGANHLAPAAAPARAWTTPRFLFVGIGWERKGGHELLEAFAQVRHLVPSAELDLVGDHPVVDAAGVRGHGTLKLDDPAESQQLSDLFAAATCVVVPSRFEPTGIVFAEAAHAGVGSIGSTAGGSATVIGDGGMLVPPHDIAALAESMLRMTEPERAQAYGAAAAARADDFTWTRSAQRLLAAAGLGQKTHALV